jgi:hypothetical protein
MQVKVVRRSQSKVTTVCLKQDGKMPLDSINTTDTPLPTWLHCLSSGKHMQTLLPTPLLLLCKQVITACPWPFEQQIYSLR